MNSKGRSALFMGCLSWKKLQDSIRSTNQVSVTTLLYFLLMFSASLNLYLFQTEKISTHSFQLENSDELETNHFSLFDISLNK